MKVGVTGGTGFIGSKLVEKLVANNFEVKVLVRNPKKTRFLKKLDVEIYEGDLSNTGSLTNFPKDCDYIFHLAAHVSDWGPREQFFKLNVDATHTLLSESLNHGVKRFIHMSSSTVVWKSTIFSVHDLKDINEVYPCPNSFNDFYNESKAESEKIVLDFYKKTGLETVVIRPSNVWGAGDTVILPRIVMAARKKMLIPMGFNESIVTPCHVDNLVHSLLLAAQSPNSPGKIYFINDGNKIGHSKFLGDQLKASGVDWEPKFKIPYVVGYSIAAILEFVYKILKSEEPPVLTRFAVAALSGSRSYSTLRARRDLDYKPIISYKEGMKRLEEWVKNIGGFKTLIEE